MSKKSWNKIIIDHLSESPIAFIPTLGHFAGSANAGLFMSQLLFWWKKGRNKDWIYKTIEEVQEETCLSRSEQDIAIKKWIELGVLSKKRMGIPPKRFFRIDTDKLADLVVRAKRNAEKSKTICEAPQHNTESTAQSTAKTFRIYNTGAGKPPRTESKKNGVISNL